MAVVMTIVMVVVVEADVKMKVRGVHLEAPVNGGLAHEVKPDALLPGAELHVQVSFEGDPFQVHSQGRQDFFQNLPCTGE
jgi:hypothetical protein